MTDDASLHANTTPLSLGYGDFMRFGKLIYDRYGLNFPEKRRSDLERGVRSAFAASTCASLDEYFDLLQDPIGGASHMERLLNAITISESHFFRDTPQFDALYSRVLPQIIQRRRNMRTLRIWSAGCANGEEPYSLAMMLREMLPDLKDWSITILGTDINTEVLDRARKGIYSEWAFREERAKSCQVRYFRHHENRFELSPEIRRMVTFARLNLAEAEYPSFHSNTMYMDLVLCRNVMIYFSPSITQAVVDRFYDTLVDGGWLVIGHAEHSIPTFHKFQAHNFPGSILYQRTGQPTHLPKGWEGLNAPKPETLHPAAQPIVPLPPATAPAPAQPASVSRPPVFPEKRNPVEHARELVAYAHLEEARQLLQTVEKTHPDYPAACALLGRIFADMGSWDKASHWCQQAIALDKLLLEAYYTQALVLRHQGQLPQAIEAMKKVIYIDRNHVLAHYGLADLYSSSNQMPLALKALDNALRLLARRPAEEILPDSGGVTVERLRQTITSQQQQWSAR